MSPRRLQLGRVPLAVAVLVLPLVPLPAHPQSPPAAVADALGREVDLRPAPYRRVISLVPSATDLIVALGAADRLVGRTRYDSAAAVRDVASVGEPLSPSLERLVRLDPELVIAWPDARKRGTGARLEALAPVVYFAETSTVEDVDRLLADLGALLGRRRAADSLGRVLDCQLRRVARAVAGHPPVRVAHLVWPDPLFAAGPGSYLDSLVRVAGGRNALADAGSAWPRVSLESLIGASPDVVLLGGGAADGTWETLTGRSAWRGLDPVRSDRVHTVPGGLFHRPGPRMGRAAAVLAGFLHPDAEVPDPSVCVPPPDARDAASARKGGGSWDR